MVYKGWTIRVARLAAPPGYLTPFCAWATYQYGSRKRLGFNREGHTEDEARSRAIVEIDKGVVFQRLLGNIH